MRRLLRLLTFVLFLALLGSYLLWTQLRPSGHYLSDLRSELALDRGEPGARGNLLGIQPELFAGDYQSRDRLELKFAAYLEKARAAGLLNARTVVVLPEHVGTWLLLSGEKPEVYQASSLREAMTWMAASNPLRLGLAWLAARGDDRLTDALLRMKARRMANDYQTLFGGLARRFGVTLVAGSIILPEPRLEAGQLRVGQGPLYNVSLVFGSDGEPLGQPQRKHRPTNAERPFLAAAADDELQPLETPAGRLGVLIGADADQPQLHALLRRQGVQLLAVPAFLAANPHHPPQDDSTLGRLAENAPAPAIAVFMGCRLWELGCGGRSLVVTPLEAQHAEVGSGARLINLWL